MRIEDYRGYLITIKNENEVLDVFLILDTFGISLWSEDISPGEAVTNWMDYRDDEPHIYLEYSYGDYSPCFRSKEEYRNEEENRHIISAEKFIRDYYD